MRLLDFIKVVRKRSVALGLLVVFIVGSASATAYPVAAFKDAYDSIYYNGASIRFYDPRVLGCGVSGATVTALKGKDNREKIWNYFLSVGLSDEQAAGILGNIQSETAGTFSPTIQEYFVPFGLGGGYGIAQWTGGRRDQLIAFMQQRFQSAEPKTTESNEKAPGGSPQNMLLFYYYNALYSFPGRSYGSEAEGYIPKNALTGALIPVEDNDALLLAQLDFLMKETNDRIIRPATALKVSSVSVGDGEMSSIRKLKTIEDVSNTWVYNFEVPANISETAKARVINAIAIHDKYSGNSSSSRCSGFSGALTERIVQIAEQELALWAKGDLKPGSDYKKYTYNISGDWCAWFVSWVLKEAGHPVNDTDSPDWPAVSQFLYRSPTLGFVVHPRSDGYKPKAGDLAIYDGHTHINIVIGYDDRGRMLTIGGNQGAGPNGNYTSSRVSRNIGYGSGATSYVEVK